MQFRIFDGDMERWDEEEISLTPEELRRRFGVKNSATDPSLSQQPGAEEDSATPPQVEAPIDTKHAHKITAPAYDVFDQDLADRQFAEFLKAGDSNNDEGE